MTEFRYDGPDVENDMSGRVQGLLMTSMMVAEGAQSGRTARRTRDTAETPSEPGHAGPARPTRGDYAELDDAALARHWTSATAAPTDPEAQRARRDIENVLSDRDPQTMRDYRSWQHGAGIDDPREAMRLALADRERRLADAWKPLSTPHTGTRDPQQLAAGWLAALGSHDPAARGAADAAETQLRTQLPELMAGYDDARQALTATAAGTREPDLVTGYAAAQQALGQPLAFGPQTLWADIAHPRTEQTPSTHRILPWRHPSPGHTTPAASRRRSIHQ